jgi:RNA polymerase sigma factor (sigma-70 family)
LGVSALLKDVRQSFVSNIAVRYGDRLRRFLSQRLRNVSDAPDLAQEVFLRLLRVEHHETIRSPEAYLFTVASHVLHQHTLRQSMTPVSVDISELFSELQLTSNDDPVASVDLEQRLNHLQYSLKQLPPKVSTTLMLHRFAGFSIEEIGQQIGVTRRTAKKYLARALTHCRAAEAGAADKDAR